MASFWDLSKSNLSYYTVPAAFALALVPYATQVLMAGKNYELAYPHHTAENCAKDSSIDKKALRRIERAKSAFNNGVETLGLYAAGVVAANAAGVSTPRLNALTLGYLASRVVYNIVYVVLLEDRRLAPVRSATWMMGIVMVTTLYVLAGNEVNGVGR